MNVPFKYFDPDLGLPSLDRLGGGEPNRGTYTGTKGLMLAVLEDGIRSYLSPVRRISAEAESWVGDGRSRSQFSFVVICEALGLDPVPAREAVRELRTDPTQPTKCPATRAGSGGGEALTRLRPVQGEHPACIPSQPRAARLRRDTPRLIHVTRPFAPPSHQAPTPAC